MFAGAIKRSQKLIGGQILFFLSLLATNRKAISRQIRCFYCSKTVSKTLFQVLGLTRSYKSSHIRQVKILQGPRHHITVLVFHQRVLQ